MVVIVDELEYFPFHFLILSHKKINFDTWKLEDNPLLFDSFDDFSTATTLNQIAPFRGSAVEL